MRNVNSLEQGDVMKYRIEHDESVCIGCAACTAICPKYWVMNGLKSKNLKTEFEDEDLECNMQAAESCPVNCIHIYNEKGEKLI